MFNYLPLYYPQDTVEFDKAKLFSPVPLFATTVQLDRLTCLPNCPIFYTFYQSYIIQLAEPISYSSFIAHSWLDYLPLINLILIVVGQFTCPLCARTAYFSYSSNIVQLTILVISCYTIQLDKADLPSLRSDYLSTSTAAPCFPPARTKLARLVYSV